MAVQYRYLGGSGVKVSNICLGTMTFGQSQNAQRPGQCDEVLSHKIMDRYAELGGNFIDTANVYVMGVSESIVGSWLAKRKREDFVLATKVRFQMDPNNPNSGGLSRKNIIWSLEESLRRLRTDYIDLYQIHAWDPATPIEETVRTLDDLVRAGKIRYVGASNVTGWQMQKIMDLCQYKGFNRWVSLQAQYSLLNRELEWELVDCCKNEGLGILPWSPLKGGWLTGKMNRDAAPEGSRVAFVETRQYIARESHPTFSQFVNEERVWTLLDTMKSIADQQALEMKALIAEPSNNSMLKLPWTLSMLKRMGFNFSWKEIGWLTGKIKRDSAPEGSRVAFVESRPEIKMESHPNFSKFSQEEKVWNLLDVMRSVADEAGKTVSQVALRWLLQKEAVCSVIIGVKTLEQLNANMGASTGWELTADQMDRLNEASAVALPYPYSMITRTSQARLRNNWTQ